MNYIIAFIAAALTYFTGYEIEEQFDVELTWRYGFIGYFFWLAIVTITCAGFKYIFGEED